MRLFFAIEPSQAARTAIDGVLSDASGRLGPDAAALRWIAKENLHLTLQFLGEVHRDRADALVTALQPPIALRPFTVSLDRFGVFPPSGPPRTIWLGVNRGADELRQIHAELDRRLAALRFDPDGRPYSPHLTVARVRDEHRSRASAVRSTLASMAVPAVTWEVAHATLFESDLSGPKPRYTARARVDLGDNRRL
jgi:2'-5' RNA ligase